MIIANHISKSFGRKTVIDDLSFCAKAGRVTGLLGANGCGKTTTMRLLSTIIKPDCGTIKICDIDAINNPKTARKKIGILLGGDIALYDRLTAYENIMYFAKLQGVETKTANQRIEEFASIFKMDTYINNRVENFSRGMRQKIALVRTTIHEPEVLLLDEPSTGLDIYSIRDVHNFISNEKQKGKTILLSTHNTAEIEALCDDIAIIKNGKIILYGAKSDMMKKVKATNAMEMFFNINEDRI